MAIQPGKDDLFNKGCRSNWVFIRERKERKKVVKDELKMHHRHKHELKTIKYLHHRKEFMYFLGLGKDFLDMR